LGKKTGKSLSLDYYSFIQHQPGGQLWAHFVWLWVCGLPRISLPSGAYPAIRQLSTMAASMQRQSVRHWTNSIRAENGFESGSLTTLSIWRLPAQG
jgi:hypothetical protein